MVSFLLSIFSFSAFAVGESTHVTFHPRVLRDINFYSQESGGGEQALPSNGKKVDNAPGDSIDNVKYEMHRIDDQKVNEYIDFENSKLRCDASLVRNDVSQKKFNVNVNNGFGSVNIKEEDYGYYYVEMVDLSNQGVTCESFVISVPSTDLENGSKINDMHLYPKVTLKRHNITVKKLINGLELDDIKQSERVKKANWVMEFKIQRKDNLGNWHDCFNGQTFTTNDRNSGRDYGKKKIENLINGQYRIVEEKFLASGADNDNGAFDTLGKMFKNTNIENQMFEFELTGNDDDKDIKVNNIMTPQISKFIMNQGLKYLTFGVNPGDDINYKLEIEKPYLKGQEDMNINDFKAALNGLNRFDIVDNDIRNGDLLSSVHDVKDSVVVKFVDGHGVETQLVKGQDYTIADYFRVKFINNGQVSDRVANLIYNSRGDSRAHFEIDFKVTVKDQLLLRDVVKDLRQNNNLDLDSLSIVNQAKVEIGATEKATSNKVRSQLGVINVNKQDPSGNKLEGAQFELFDNNGLPLNVQVSSNANGIADFIVPIGKNIEFDYKNDYLHHSGITGSDDALLDNKIKDNFSDNALKNNDAARKYQVKEISAPDGYEVIGKAFNVTMDECIKKLDITNYPKIELPFTGGMGTILFTVVGILLIGSGAFLYMNSRRKKSAE